MNHDQLSANLHRTVASARIECLALPLVPEIQLFLISEDYPRGRLPHDEMLAILNDPAYWAFCWASGQVLARFLLDHPDEVRDKTVLDFGTGSGVVAIAAVMAGARDVVACDIDPMAIDATVANAALNGVAVRTHGDLLTLDEHFDVAIAADVLYDRENMGWLDRLADYGDNVLVADSRIKNVEVYGYDLLDRIHATTIPDLDESREFNDVRVYRRR